MAGTRIPDNRPDERAGSRHEVAPSLPRLLGGRLCLDFANTVEDRAGRRPVDCLRDYLDLARWGGHAGVLRPEQVRSLLAEAGRQPETAGAVFALAIALREAIYRVFRAVARGEPRPEPDLATLGAAYVDALARARLTERGDRVAWSWPADARDLTRPLSLVAHSAIEVLTGPDLGRVKLCAGPDGGCGWLFLDVSKNGSRRWCSMEGCGSQAKMRRRYARTKSAESLVVSR